MGSKYEIMNDEQLFRLLRGDDVNAEKAFSAIYERHSRCIYGYCMRFLGNKEKSEDIFQETFIVFLNAVRGNKEIHNIMAYLLKTARNLCLKSKRDNKVNFLSIEDFNIPFDDKPVEAAELENLLVSSLDALSEEYREVLVLQVYNGLSYLEIAEILEVPVSTVRNRIVRAKKKIREIVTPYFENKFI